MGHSAKESLQLTTIEHLGLWTQYSGFRIEGSGIRTGFSLRLQEQDSGFRIQNTGFRIEDSEQLRRRIHQKQLRWFCPTGTSNRRWQAGDF
jgi:hypothetical protein